MLKVLMLELEKQRISLSLRTLANYAIADRYIKNNVTFDVVDIQINNSSISDFLLDIAMPNRTNLRGLITSLNPDVVCVSVWLWNLPYIKTLLGFLKAINSDMHIITGGMGVFDPKSFILDNPQVSMHCYEREGEESFVDILYFFLGLKKISDVSGIVYIDAISGNVHQNKRSCRKIDITRLDNIYLNFPPKYTFHNNLPVYVVLEMYRGCVYKCSYCSWGSQIKRNFFKNTEKIKKEIESFDEDTHFEIGDSFINTPEHMSVLSKLGKRFEYISVNVEHRINTIMVRDFIDSLKSFRKVLIDIGVQSMDADVLQAINRKNNMESLKEWSSLLKNSEEMLLSYHILLGLPYQTMEILKKDIELVSYLGTYMVFSVIALPNSDYTLNSESWGAVFEKDFPFSFVKSNYISAEDVAFIKQKYGFIKEFGMESQSHIKSNLLEGY